MNLGHGTFQVMINIDFTFEEEEGKTINRKQCTVPFLTT